MWSSWRRSVKSRHPVRRLRTTTIRRIDAVSGNRGPVLVLYWNPYGRDVRATVDRHLRAVCRVADPTAVVSYNCVGGAPSLLRLLRPRAIVLHTTFLAIRWLRSFSEWRHASSWIAALDVPKLALPQDDYDHAAVLDEWLVELGVTDVFTPFPAAESLYPGARRAARLHGVLTGYVDRDDAHRWRTSARALVDRPNDVVYRATRLPFWFGSLGQLKARVADEAITACTRLGLEADIETDGVIAGDRWFDHLASGRVVVGCESGSSVLDARGETRRRIEELLGEEPGLSFAQVSRRMPAGWDDQWFAALSPRHLEAAVTGTAQVLVEGRYSGVLEANRHYLPVRRDLSDLGDALLRAADPAAAAELAETARAELVESGRFDYGRLTEQLRAAIPDLGPARGLSSSWLPLVARAQGTTGRVAARLRTARPRLR